MPCHSSLGGMNMDHKFTLLIIGWAFGIFYFSSPNTSMTKKWVRVFTLPIRKWGLVSISDSVETYDFWALYRMGLSPLSVVMIHWRLAGLGKRRFLDGAASGSVPASWGWGSLSHLLAQPFFFLRGWNMMLIRLYSWILAPWGPINFTLLQLLGTLELNPDQLAHPRCLVISAPSLVLTILCSIFIFNCPDLYLI